MGDDATFLREISTKVGALALNVRAYKLPRKLLRMLLQQSLEKSTEHALAPTTINEAKGRELVLGVQWHLLPMMGVVGIFPLQMRHAPFHFRGLCVHHPYHERGRQQIETLLQFYGEKSHTSRILEDSVDSRQGAKIVSGPSCSSYGVPTCRGVG